jgi:tRNA 2-selenouridine synthase
MQRQFSTLTDLLNHGFDTAIDVRSPAEFAEDHLPGAINLPALSNSERAEIGTMYVQQSPFLARKHGAALVARNVAHHIETQLIDHDGGWRPLIYCWRGGQRSGSVAMILSQIGWRAGVIEGGYKTYRRLVSNLLYETDLPHQIILLDGNTGSGKTVMLEQLQARGVQTLDLEAMAGHRGSLLGGLPKGQPSQKSFESALALAISKLDPARPVVVEAESSKIGQRIIPPALWARMSNAPRILLQASPTTRAQFLTRQYVDIRADPAALSTRIAPLKAYCGQARLDHWNALIESGDFEDLAAELVIHHYDPAYARSARPSLHPIQKTFELEALSVGEIAQTADQIAIHLNTMKHGFGPHHL